MKSSRSSSTLSLSVVDYANADDDRILGTPDENTWPGVTSLPDFKTSFPKWRREAVAKHVPTLEPAGIELIEAMLEYDPAHRMSAKAACTHAYFAAGSAAYSQRGPIARTNGFH
jgi:cyclin-dependent kinase